MHLISCHHAHLICIRVRPRDLSELGRRLVGRKSPRAPQCSNLEGFAGPRDPTEIFEFIPRSVVIKNIYAKSLRDSKCLIEELDKDDKT